MERKYIDFHTHTEFSDGVSSPEHLVRVASLQELDAIAVTDHDRIDGYERAREEGLKWGLRVLLGVEVSTDKYHILGLGINPKNEGLVRFLDYSAAEQKKVTIARIGILQRQGVPITLEKLECAFPHSRLGKMNLMMAMMQDSQCREYFLARGEKFTQNVYNRTLEDKGGKEIADKMTAVTPERAIQEIHNAGGIAIIAHPFKDVKDMAEMDELRRLGLEIQPTHNGRNEPFRKYAQEHNLLITFGSDYHAGLFKRVMLDGKGNYENLLYPRLTEALGGDIK